MTIISNMDTIFYYLCCFGCFGNCCQKRFVKKELSEQSSKRIQRLHAISPTSRSTVKTPPNPLSVKTDKISDFYKIPSNKFKTEDQVIAFKGFKIGSELGKGAFGTVYSATHLKTGTELAAKTVVIPKDESIKVMTKRMKAMKLELITMRGTKHPFVVQIITDFIIAKQNETKLYIFMERADKTLADLLRYEGPFDESTCKILMAQMLSAMVYMHNKMIVHRDLKLNNILMSFSNDVLISDFGLSQFITPPVGAKDHILQSKTYCGTPSYMAPELLQIKERRMSGKNSKKYDARAVDVWALGIILYNLFNKEFPFDTSAGNKRTVIKQMNARNWKFSEYIDNKPSNDFIDVLKKMLEPDPLRRITMVGISKHPWISDIYNQVEDKCKEMKKEIHFKTIN